MKSLLKAQLYQLRKSRFVWIIFVAVVILQVSTLFGEWAYRGQEIPAATYVATMGGQIIWMTLMFAIAFTGYVCGADFTDKTVNYEMMSGHSRKQAYFGRAIISMVGGCLGSMLIMAVPVIVSVAACGWGTDVKAGEVILRYMLSALPILRLICEFIFLTYITKNPYITMVGGFLTYILGQSLPDLVGKTDSVLLGIMNISMLTEFESWSTYTLDNTVDMIVVYGAKLSAGDIASTIFASAIIGGLFLVIGYLYFNRDDLN